MALGQLDHAIEALSGENGSISATEAVHEARKALKRVRALLTLLEDQLGTAGAREKEAVREAGRRVAGARDAAVMVNTLDALLRREPALARRRGVAELRSALLTERDTAETALNAHTRSPLLDDLRALRGGVAAWQLPASDDPNAFLPALGDVYTRGRRRYRRARRRGGNRAARMHRWRKRVKDLRYVAEALSRSEPSLRERTALASALQHGRRREQAARRSAVKEMRRLARRADTLGELLGEEHDLVLLGARVRAEIERGERGGRRRLLRLIGRRRKRLRREALRRGARLYQRKPKRLRRALAQK
jgi:CHAD domain-containing protein